MEGKEKTVIHDSDMTNGVVAICTITSEIASIRIIDCNIPGTLSARSLVDLTISEVQFSEN